MQKLEEFTIPENSYRTLNAIDRCDRCSVQAFVRAVKVIEDREHELLFCGHHYQEMEPKLIAQGFLIQDDRHLINPKPTVYED